MTRLTKKTASALGGGIVLSLSLLALSACDTEGYCVDCFDANGTGGGLDGGAVEDAAIIDGGGSGDFDACVLSGLEQCDGKDNDCDGNVDEGDLTGVDEECGSDVGLCELGVTVCEEGAIVCQGGVGSTFELCNTFDDDCDGASDENNPEGGIICGTNQGECVAGVQLCTAGVLSCDGQVTGSIETCNGLDDDCDGSFDENITVSGNCGPDTDTGECSFGTQICIGGAIQCSGAVLPELEQCDVLDRDCDGDSLNGFNLATDVRNCGACGTVCSGDNAFMGCVANTCVIAACETDFFDLNGTPADGCEFGPCSFQGNEICDGQDNDCDGNIDEGVNLNAPDICDQDGECAGATASCDSVVGAFVCNYGNTVSTNGSGDIIAEIDCDERDNDCDGRVDEAFVTKGASCDDGEIGACRDLGLVVCNGTDDGVECTAVDDDGVPPAESCNNIDDDCDGVIDESDPRDWVDIGGGVEMFQYEASRPDSTDVANGFIEDAAVCSDADRQPWTNITQPQAEAACARIGARLCSETEWQASCIPEVIGTGVEGSDGLLVFETFEESDFGILAFANGWFFSTENPGFSGGNYLLVPDGNVSDTNNPSSLGGAPRVDYDLQFTSTGNHFMWVRVLELAGENSSLWWSFDDTDGNISEDFIDLDPSEFGNWVWVGATDNGNRMQFNVASTGAHTISFYNRGDGMLVDKVIVTTDVGFVPEGHGQGEECQWSYENDCRDYQPATCNGEDFDGDPVAAGDQDVVLTTGSLAACFSEQSAGGQLFDMSGNIKEWTAQRAPGVNPLRGGSFNNTEVGISCQFDFLTADDSFFLPNIGFRCCR